MYTNRGLFRQEHLLGIEHKRYFRPYGVVMKNASTAVEPLKH